MWWILILLTSIPWLEASDHPESPPDQKFITRGALGRFRLRFLNIVGDSMQTVNGDFSNLPDPALTLVLDGIALYLSNALSVYQVSSGISVPDCDGNSIPLTNDADFIILIKNNINNNDLKALTCSNQPNDRENPIAGLIEINPFLITLPPRLQYEMLLKRTIKVLGFSQSQSEKWKQSNGEPYEELIKTIDFRDQTRRFLFSPNVIEKLSAFNEKPFAMELENRELAGSPDTWAWEGRILPCEILSTPDINQINYRLANPYISTITLAMLEDSGWYYPDYYLAQPPLIQRDADQTFFEHGCYGTTESRYADPFAIPEDDALYCSGLGTAKGYNRDFYKDYEYADTCHIPLDFLNCYPVETGHEYYFPFEKTGVNSRCFTGSFDIYSKTAFCFEIVSCDNDIIIFNTQEGTYNCSYEGEVLRIPEYEAEIYCPKKDSVCKETSCLNMCMGNGYCRDSFCHCFDGYSGPDCSVKFTDCGDGHYLSGIVCLPCDSNCKTCFDYPEQCTSCRNGMYHENNQCFSCNPKCSFCISLTECEGCKSGYHLKDSNCCKLGCESCNDQACLTCSSGLFLYLGECGPCPRGCSTCENQLCFSCNEEYYLNETVCHPCIENCLSCQNSQTCTTCKDGFQLNSCGICEDCLDNCAYCTKNRCKRCKENYNLVKNFCYQSSCKTWNSGNCLSCYNGYIFNQGQCLLCPDTCSNCVNGVCIGCNSGFFKFEGECFPCVNHCDKCSDELTCITCSPGYKKNLEIKCDLRTDCSPGCIRCTKSACLECNAGYYLNSGVCYKCAPGCLFCNSLWDCEVCANEYEKVDKVCCDNNCEICTPYGCQKCRDKYYLVDGKCENCPANCIGCKNGVCKDCKDKYYLNNGSCFNCPSSCNSCKIVKGKVTCVECSEGFTLINGGCRRK